MKTQITSALWWRAAFIRAFRTFLLVGVTYVPASYTDAVPWVVLGSAALGAGVFSIVTSLAGLAEVDGKSQPWYFAILSRVVKTIGQALASGALANIVFISDINWDAVLATSIAAGFGSLLLGVLKQLPEADEPTSLPVGTTTVTINNPAAQSEGQAVPTVVTDTTV